MTAGRAGVLATLLMIMLLATPTGRASSVAHDATPLRTVAHGVTGLAGDGSRYVVWLQGARVSAWDTSKDTRSSSTLPAAADCAPEIADVHGGEALIQCPQVTWLRDLRRGTLTPLGAPWGAMAGAQKVGRTWIGGTGECATGGVGQCSLLVRRSDGTRVERPYSQRAVYDLDAPSPLLVTPCDRRTTAFTTPTYDWPYRVTNDTDGRVVLKRCGRPGIRLAGDAGRNATLGAGIVSWNPGQGHTFVYEHVIASGRTYRWHSATTVNAVVHTRTRLLFAAQGTEDRGGSYVATLMTARTPGR